MSNLKVVFTLSTHGTDKPSRAGQRGRDGFGEIKIIIVKTV